MNFDEKKERAIAIMESKTMRYYTPRLLRLAWKVGIKIPPLPFASFLQIILLVGGWFGSVWGIFMWFFIWRSTGMQPGVAFVISIIAGICFGIFMAGHYRHQKVANNLPDWDSLG